MTPDANYFLSVLHACSDRCFDLNDDDDVIHTVKNVVKQMDKLGVKLTPSHYSHVLAVWAEKVVNVNFLGVFILNTNAATAGLCLLLLLLLLLLPNPFLEVCLCRIPVCFP